MHEAHTDADILPLWSAANDLPLNGHAHEYSDNVRSAADRLGHHPERVSSLPTHLRDDSSRSDVTKFETSWFRSTKKNSTSRRNTFEPEKVLPNVRSDRPLQPARIPPKASIYDYIPLLRFFRWIFRIILRRAAPPDEDAARKKKKNRDTVESNVPLEIILVLSR